MSDNGCPCGAVLFCIAGELDGVPHRQQWDGRVFAYRNNNATRANRVFVSPDCPRNDGGEIEDEGEPHD